MQAANLYINGRQQSFNIICMCLTCRTLQYEGSYICMQSVSSADIIKPPQHSAPYRYAPLMAFGTLKLALSIQLSNARMTIRGLQYKPVFRTAQNIYFLQKGYILPQKLGRLNKYDSQDS